MRGSESQEGRPPPSTLRPPLPPSHHSNFTNGASTGYKSSGRQGYSSSGGHVISNDVFSFADKPPTVGPFPKHTRMPGASSDPAVAYKRVIESEAFKDTGSDVLSRPPKTKVAKSRSDSSAMEQTNSKYAPTSAFGKNPKRQKHTKREKAEKLSVSKLPKSDSDRPTLGRRSKTFVVESSTVSDFPKDRSAEVLWREPQPKPRTRKPRQDTDISTDPHPKTKRVKDLDESSPERQTKDHSVFSEKVPVGPEVSKRPDVPSRSKRNQWEEPAYTTDSVRRLGPAEVPDQDNAWNPSDELPDRDGARNPLYISTSSMPIRPKSAGQLRYVCSDDSDESSLDGEIEIVDIDKELEDDPSEPSPYWSEGQPLQIPEVFVDLNEQDTALPFNSRAGYPTPQQPQNSLYHRPVQHHHVVDSRSSNMKNLRPRERHHSGESDLSALSDTIVKPVAKANGRRRFMSEPEILSEPYLQKTSRHGAADTKYRNVGNGENTKKGPAMYLRESSREVIELSPLTKASLARQSRERIYSDAMERVLSRYSELAVREESEISSGSKLGSTPSTGSKLGSSTGSKLGSTSSTGSKSTNLNRGPASGLGTGSGNGLSGHVRQPTSSSGFIIPPRKLKPINRQPRNNASELP